MLWKHFVIRIGQDTTIRALEVYAFSPKVLYATNFSLYRTTWVYMIKPWQTESHEPVGVKFQILVNKQGT